VLLKTGGRRHVGDHFKEPDTLADVVPVRFSIYDAAQHYHVPMLCAPWFFSTYRGS
jgi:5-hydroxyisourate hydrolase